MAGGILTAKDNPFISDSLQATFDKLDHLQSSLPTTKGLISPLDIKQPELNPILFQAPEIKIPPIAEKLDQICEFNQQLVEANKELSVKLATMEAAHRYDWIKDIGLVVISIALTILATKLGWL